VSKPHIRFKGKAPADKKAQHTCWYVSILKRLATQPLDVRWGFETTSSKNPWTWEYGFGYTPESVAEVPIGPAGMVEIFCGLNPQYL